MACAASTSVWQQAPAERICSHSGMGMASRTRLTTPTNHRGTTEAFALGAQAFFADIRIVFAKALSQNLAHAGSRLAFEYQEPPWRELAVIGHSRGSLNNCVEFRSVGSRAGHRLCGARPAAQQQSENARRRIVEGLFCHFRGVFREWSRDIAGRQVTPIYIVL